MSEREAGGAPELFLKGCGQASWRWDIVCRQILPQSHLASRMGWLCQTLSNPGQTSSQPAPAHQQDVFPAPSPMLATQGVALSPCTAVQDTTAAGLQCCNAWKKCLFLHCCAQRSSEMGLPQWSNCRHSASDSTWLLPGDDPHACLVSQGGFTFPAKMQTGFGKVSGALATCQLQQEKTQKPYFAILMSWEHLRPGQPSRALQVHPGWGGTCALRPCAVL